MVLSLSNGMNEEVIRIEDLLDSAVEYAQKSDRVLGQTGKITQPWGEQTRGEEYWEIKRDCRVLRVTNDATSGCNNDPVDYKLFRFEMQRLVYIVRTGEAEQKFDADRMIDASGNWHPNPLGLIIPVSSERISKAFVPTWQYRLNDQTLLESLERFIKGF